MDEAEEEEEGEEEGLGGGDRAEGCFDAARAATIEGGGGGMNGISKSSTDPWRPKERRGRCCGL